MLSAALVRTAYTGLASYWGKIFESECSHLDVKVVALTLRAAVCDHDVDGAGVGVLVAAPLHATRSFCLSVMQTCIGNIL